MTIYARVNNGHVFEYNLTEKQITDRGDRLGQYLPVKFGFKPTQAPKYHCIAEETELFDTYVKVNYVIRPLGLASLLIRVHCPDGDLQNVIEGMTIGNVDPVLVNAIFAAAQGEVQKLLDRFARQRNYDGITSTITYRNSPVPSFQAEGVRANEVRDLSWAALYTYLGEVQAGIKPLPRRVDDILAELPAMTW